MYERGTLVEVLTTAAIVAVVVPATIKIVHDGKPVRGQLRL